MSLSMPGAAPVVSRVQARDAVAILACVAVLAAGVAAAPGWSGVMTALWVIVLAVFRRVPAVGAAALAFAVPLDQQFWIPTLAGDLTVTRYLGWALVFAIVPALSVRRRVTVDSIAVALALFVATLVASFAAGGVRAGNWALEIEGWVLPLLVYVVVRSLGFDMRQRLLVLGGVATGVTVTSLTAGYQLLFGTGPESYYVGGFLRVFGTFLHPNTLGAFLALTLPPLVWLAITRGDVVTWLARIAVVAGTGALVLTQSRGGWLAFGVAAALTIVLAPRRVQRIAFAAAMGGVLLALGSGMVAEMPGVGRFASIAGIRNGEAQVTPETWGQLERQAHWGAARSMMASDPLFGVGAGEFNVNYREHTPEWRFRVGRGHAHNVYLQMGAQAGLPGFVTFTVCVGTILVGLWRRVSRTSGGNYLLALGALGTAVAYATNGMFESFDVPSLNIMLVLIVAVGLGRGAAPSREFRDVPAARSTGAVS